MNGELRIELLREIGLPERYHATDLDDYFGSPSALRQVHKYLRRFQYAYDNGLGLLLFGDTNSGKTLLLCHLLKNIAYKGFTCSYVTIRQIIDAEMKVSGSLSFRALVKEPQVLCLDNLEEIENKFELRLLQRTLKIRMDENRPTLLGTQIPPERFPEVFSADFKPVIDKGYILVPCESEAFKVDQRARELKSKLEI